MKLLLGFSSLFVFHLITAAAALSTQYSRVKYNFNADWKVLVDDPEDAEAPGFDDSAWKDITTPHAWNEDDAFRVGIHDLSTGIAWYRKHFRVPDTTEDKKLFLEFEGIRHAGEFYLNGEWIGRSENGVMAFGFDVTAFVLQGEDNVIAAKIDNDWDYREKGTHERYQWNDHNFYANYGGINKNVYLHVTDRLYQTLPLYSNLETTGVYVYAQDIDIDGKTANITVETQVRNEYSTSKTFTYQVVIEDLDGQPVATLNGEKYTLTPNETTTIGVSEVVSGLEFWSWGYGYLYNVYTTLIVDAREIDTVMTRTGFRKTDFEDGMLKLNDRALHIKGYAQRTTNEWVALGSAVPAWLSDFSNQLVLESHGNLIRWMHVTPWKQDVESLDRLGLLQAMPAGDSEADLYGRPWAHRVELMRDAVIYNKNNPSIIFYEAGNRVITEGHMEEMKEIRDTYDPHGGRAAGSREMLDSKVAEYGGEMLYINKDAQIPMWQMEYSRDEGLRKYWDEFSPPYHPDGDGPLYRDEDASEYNRNQDSHAIENVVRWFDYYEMRPGTGDRVNAGGVNIVFSDSNTHNRGEENYRCSGEVDPVRLPKDGWYAHQVMWNNWVDVEVSSTHIIGHWNYNASTVKNIYVVSTAARVELILNGQPIGWGEQSSRFLFNFTDVAYEPGVLKAVGHGSTMSGNNETSSDIKITAGKPVGIRLTPRVSPAGFQANGADIALVDVEVIDADGNRCPTALNTIDFTLIGEATWRGGIAQGPDNYILSESLPAENGVNRVLLRSTRTPGKVTLRASSDGLDSASITLTTEPFANEDGLSTQMPAAGLVSNLSRGPTPKGESYTMKRRALVVSSVEADSEESWADDSYDGNELREWESTSSGPEAWITYTLEKSADVNEVVMKMVDFSSSTYELEISVDDRVVYTGTVLPSLGYATIGFNATNGERVTVAATSGPLGIIEAEIYAPV